VPRRSPVPRPSRRRRAATAAATAIVAATALLAGACVEPPRSGAATSAPADSAAGEIPFRLAGPGGAALVVPVHMDGRGPVDLILDTGATYTCVDSALAREWALPEQRLVRGVAVGIGGAGRTTLHRVDSLRVGPAVVRDVSVCSLDLRALRAIGGDVRGLLGLNVLRRFRVTLDFERRVLRLDPATTAASRRAADRPAPRRGG
jgi:predicted aspartyl protease